MANLQRMLGALLATRMAGRGVTGGLLGTAVMGGLGGKAGLAALAYLAYRSYRDNQKKGPDNPEADPQPQQARGDAARGGLSGIVDRIEDVIGSLTGGGAERGAGSRRSQGLGDRIGNMLDPRGDTPAEEALEDRKALLLIRAMIAAANSDGAIKPHERQRILDRLDEAGADAEDHRIIEKEMLNPLPLDQLLREVDDPETARQFYLASRAAVEGATETQRSYLAYLRQRLALPQEDVAEVEKMVG